MICDLFFTSGQNMRFDPKVVHGWNVTFDESNLFHFKWDLAATCLRSVRETGWNVTAVCGNHCKTTILARQCLTRISQLKLWQRNLKVCSQAERTGAVYTYVETGHLNPIKFQAWSKFCDQTMPGLVWNGREYLHSETAKRLEKQMCVHVGNSFFSLINIMVKLLC